MRTITPVLWLLLAVLLNACGAERDGSIDLSDTSSSASSSAQPINTVTLLQAQQTLRVIDGNKQTLIFRNQNNYYLFLDRYSDQSPSYEPNFNQGQVVLIDMGQNEDSLCHDRLTLENVHAEKVNDKVARLVVKYSERDASSQANCPAVNADTFRPFAFYYIETRSRLIVDESITDAES